MKIRRDVKLHATLSALIEAKGYSRNRKKVCDEVGITPSALSHYVLEKATPKFETLLRLAEFFEVSLDYLVYGEQSTSASAIDYGPVYHYMDQSLADLQAKTDRQTWMFARISRVLVERIKGAARQIVDESPSAAGLLRDDETLVLEQFSEETWVISLNLQYDMKDAETPGRFMEVVGNNLSKGRRYRFVVPSTRDWQPVVSQYLKILQQHCSNDMLVLENCKFKLATLPLMAGCVFYHLNVKDLEKERPILYQQVKNSMSEDNWIGYLLPPSKEFQGDALMDVETLNHARAQFEEVWQAGKPIEKPRSPRKLTPSRRDSKTVE